MKISTNNSVGRRVMRLYLGSGLIIVAVMMFVGLTMRMAQAGWLTIQPGLFYELLTLHGAGMVVALVVCAMGGLWFLMHRRISMSAPLAITSWVLIMVGVVAAIVAVVFGHYSGLYSFLDPLPFMGSWPNWATGVFLIGMALINIGWMIWCFQILGAVARAYGGVRGALGWDYVWHPKAFAATGLKPPPVEAFPAVVAAVDGLITGMSATLLVVALLARWMDPRILINPLWAKNLTYSYLHTLANLIIYMLAAFIYVGLSYAAKREYHTSRVFVMAWWSSLVFIMTNYFHHLYMDASAQPRILQYIGELSSYLTAVPVTAVTVFGALMLVWRSQTKWTLGAVFMYSGLVGWVVGGMAAEIDATASFNLHLHNTLWVPAHFHTYMLGGCLLFVLGWVFLLLEARSQRSTSILMRWIIFTLTFGGMLTFLLGFYFAGATGVPRRYNVEPPPGPFIAEIASVGAIIMIAGFAFAFFEGLRLRSGFSADRVAWPEDLQLDASSQDTLKGDVL
ncbi:MAG: cbb3-type cytochrome c oxidase subunit I [Acidobacteriaceae bacterium]